MFLPLSSSTPFYCLSVLLLLLALLALHWVIPINSDTAWLLHVAGQVLEGQRLYIDTVETNPPLIVWIHQSGVMLGTMLGITPQQAFAMLVILLMAFSLRMLASNDGMSKPECAALMIALIALLPNNFAQREQLFLLLALPYFLSLLFAQTSPSLLQGLMAGAGCCIKPHFVLVLIMVWSLCALRKRSLRLLLQAPQLTVMAVGASYASYLWAYDRTYLEVIVPILIEGYSGFNMPLAEMASVSAALMGYGLLPLLLASLWDTLHRSYRSWLLLIAAAFAVVVLQQKGWANHWYLVFVLLMPLNLRLMLDYYPKRVHFMGKLIYCWAGSVLLFFAVQSAVKIYELSLRPQALPLTQRMALLQDAQGESLFSLSFDLPSAFPMVEVLGMRLISPHPHLWFLPGFAMQGCARNLPVALHQPEAMSAVELSYFHQMVEAFTRSKPNWVVVGRTHGYTLCGQSTALDILAYYQQDAAFAAAWEAYAFAAEIEGDRYFRRRANW